MKPAFTNWNPAAYGQSIASLLALAGDGERLMPLAEGTCCSEQARARIQDSKLEDLFASARAPRAALAGLYLYFSCREEAHEIAQSDSSVDGSYWHAVVHRQEPDAGNSSYWFHRVGAHVIFPALLGRARAIEAAYPGGELNLAETWEPITFIEICEKARGRPGSELERVALEIQRAEWQLLFDHCARRSSS
jgi:hypothetical protein